LQLSFELLAIVAAFLSEIPERARLFLLPLSLPLLFVVAVAFGISAGL
jgi:hypothetical protein